MSGNADDKRGTRGRDAKSAPAEPRVAGSLFAHHLPHLLVPSARQRHAGDLRPRHQPPSGASWQQGHRGHAGRPLPARRRQLRRRGRGPVCDGASLGPDLRPGGAGEGEPAGPVRPARGHVALHGSPVPGDRVGGAGPRRRRGARALGDSHRPGRRAGRAPARGAMRDHHARRRRVREPGAGIRFSHPMVRAARHSAGPCGTRTPSPRSPTTAGSTPCAPGRRSGASDSSSMAPTCAASVHHPTARAWIRASGRR